MREYILNIISMVIGAIGVSLATEMLYRKMVAERELSKKLRSKVHELSKFLDSQKFQTYANGNVDDTKLKELMEEVKQVVEELPENKRGEILDSLEQKSSKGQVNYLNKLLHMSGSNVNISAQG
jgi:hypothetical protein